MRFVFDHETWQIIGFDSDGRMVVQEETTKEVRRMTEKEFVEWFSKSGVTQ